MNKKMIIAIGGTIILVSVAATYFALELSSDIKPVDPPIGRIIPKETPAAVPEVKKVEPTVAYGIYRFENEFIYIDSTVNPPDKILIVGDLGVVEANLVDSTNVTHKQCDEEIDRPLKKYELKNDYRMTPYLGLPTNAKIEMIQGEFVEKPLPKELVSRVFENFEEIQQESDLIGCTFKELGHELEIVNCKQDELLLFNRYPIGSIEIKHEPIAFTTIDNKKYLISKINGESSTNFEIQTGVHNREFINVVEGNYSEHCEPGEEEVSD